MPDARRVALIACVMLVVLRISIGWQFLYEGLWKINSRNTAQPWSAKGYLANAQGPFRPVFRNMAAPPLWVLGFASWLSGRLGHATLGDTRTRLV